LERQVERGLQYRPALSGHRAGGHTHFHADKAKSFMNISKPEDGTEIEGKFKDNILEGAFLGKGNG